MLDQLSFLKPKVKRAGNKWHVVSAKNGSKRVVSRHLNFQCAVTQAITVFNSRVIGRALRYERLRRLGDPLAQ